jgi:hypothetical protein
MVQQRMIDNYHAAIVSQVGVSGRRKLLDAGFSALARGPT